MTYSSSIAVFTDELTEIITGYNAVNNALAFKACSDAASRNLKYHRFARVNQFHVRKSLKGLVEKFNVLSNEPLANALQRPLDKLETKSYRWKPEILSLLLELSDKPAEKVRLEDLEALAPPEPPPALTWSDILVDDPYTEQGLWDDIDFGAVSLDEQSMSDDLLSKHEDSRASTPATEDVLLNAESFLVETMEEGLSGAQIWFAQLSTRETFKVTEWQVVRDTLHMLMGLKTTVYVIDTRTHQITAQQGLVMEHASRSTINDLLSSFAVIGTHVDVLRRYCQAVHRIPLLQQFAASLAEQISKFEQVIASIENQLVGCTKSQVVSLLSIREELAQPSRCITTLKAIVHEIQGYPAEQSYRLLDQLYEQTCLAQTLGDDEDFERLGRMFFHCLKTYMKTISKWMEQGEMDQNDPLSPFTATAHHDLATMWQERYSLAHINTELKAPRFLHAALPTVFASGKSVGLLRALDTVSELPSYASHFETILTYENLCAAHETISLLPFSNIFNQALQAWLQSKSYKTWNGLRKYLQGRSGLWATLDALQHIYLSRNGALMRAFGDAIFERLDAGKSSWNEKYIVEDLAREMLGLSSSIDAESLYAVQHNSNSVARQKTVKALASIQLEYRYPWLIQIVIPPSTMTAYQSISTFLLQIYRAKSKIAHHRLLTHIRGKKSALAPRIDSIRHRLLWFISILEDYIFNTAIVPSSLTLQAAMHNAANLDEMIVAHSHFIKVLEKQCLLVKTTASVHGALLSLLDLAVLFTNLQKPVVALQDSTKVFLPSKSELEDEEERGDGQQVTSESELSRDEEADFNERLRHVQARYWGLLGIVIAGLRSAGRSPGADVAWGVLAEMLKWGVEGGSA